MSRRGVAANVLTAAILAVPIVASDEPPIETGLVEDVEVRLIILDVVVLDWKGEPVSGLTREDFAVELDLRPATIESVDSTCEGSVRRPNIVLAFDYQHLDPAQRSRILDWVEAAVARGATQSSEVMVVALTGSLRVEQPLSRDLDRLQSTLARMRTDPTLAGATFPHRTEDGFVQGLSSLYDVTGTFSGPTAVILYSALFGMDLKVEKQYRDLAAQAAAARSSLYPMTVGGLPAGPGGERRWAPNPRYAPKIEAEGRRKPTSAELLYGRGAEEATPDALSRLSRESGGSPTRGSNDAGLAIVDALERMSCSYAIAVRDPAPQDERRRAVGVFVQRLGLRAIHAQSYASRSEEFRRLSAVRAAHVAPALFDTGTVRADLLTLRPDSAKRWNAQIAVSFPVEAPATGDSNRGADLDVVLRRGAGVVHRAKRTIRMQPSGEASSGPAHVTFLEPVDIEAGKYTLTAVLSDPSIATPQSVAIVVEVPEVPRGEVFLVGPILGRRSRSDVVVRDASADTKRGGFEPLIGSTLDAPTDLFVVTQVCAVGRDPVAAPFVTRAFRSDSGLTVGAFEPVSVSLDDTAEPHCASLVDEIPARSLTRGGSYVFEVALASGVSRAARITVQREDP